MRTKFDGVTTFIKTKVVSSSKLLKLIFRKTLHTKIVIEGLKEGRLTGRIPGFLSMNLPAFVNISCS